MSPQEQEFRQTIVEIGRFMHQKSWVAANDGNVSVKLNAEEILCTPTGMSKGLMKPEDMIVVDRKGNKIRGQRERTSEILLHLAIYDHRPDINAVVHAHPPVATGFAVAGRALDQATMPEVVVSFGCIPLAEYGLPGTPAIIDPMLPYIPQYDAILMGNHGAVAYGADLWQAYFKMETVEHVARITMVANVLGGPQLLNREQVKQLFEARKRYGVKCPNSMQPGQPFVAEDLSGEDPTLLQERRNGSAALLGRSGLFEN
jgi:L-fuculose-phosphate aldolase